MADEPFKILVPVGFSEQSLTALEQSLIFARAAGPDTEITFLSVVEEDGFFKKLFGGKKDFQDIKKKVKEKLDKLAKQYHDKHGYKLNTMVAHGLVYEEIARVSELISADLVVMGTNGKPQNLKKRFIGSNAYRTATIVEPPVVTVKGVRKIDKINTIIFPLVLDRRSKEKVGPSLHYARLFNAKIKLVAVLQEEDDAKIYRAHLNQVEKFIKDHGVECSHELLKPGPKDPKGVVKNVLNYAYENDGDLMIITEDDKERDITDYFLSTDVQAVVYHSEIPVMCITPSEIKWEAMWEGY